MNHSLAPSLIDPALEGELAQAIAALTNADDSASSSHGRPATEILEHAASDALSPMAREGVLTLIGELDRLRSEASQLRERVRELEDLADSDPLVPVLNRRAFTRELARLISLASRYKLEPGLVYVDLDAFKGLNDTFGHAVGDAALRHAARILSENVRESDLVGRLGGDEFAIALADGGAHAARAKADQLRAKLSASVVTVDDVTVTVTATFGAVEVLASDTAATALARADDAMYALKRARAQ